MANTEIDGKIHEYVCLVRKNGRTNGRTDEQKNEQSSLFSLCSEDSSYIDCFSRLILFFIPFGIKGFIVQRL